MLRQTSTKIREIELRCAGKRQCHILEHTQDLGSRWRRYTRQVRRKTALDRAMEHRAHHLDMAPNGCTCTCHISIQSIFGLRIVGGSKLVLKLGEPVYGRRATHLVFVLELYLSMCAHSDVLNACSILCWTCAAVCSIVVVLRCAGTNSVANHDGARCTLSRSLDANTSKAMNGLKTSKFNDWHYLKGVCGWIEPAAPVY